METDPQRTKVPTPQPHLVTDGAGDANQQTAGESEEESEHATGGEHREGQPEEGHDRRIEDPDGDEILRVDDPTPARSCGRNSKRHEQGRSRHD
ncbi:MAG TPA: hypothetical protein VFT54_02670, partial [Acidimicrobiia bacterium]|nr:hypothetical protein [Acidimicrobiia bacterium]